MYRYNLYSILKFRKIEINKLNNIDKITPPTKPSTVLFGLILFNLVFPKNFPNKYEKTSNVTIIKINRLKFTMLIFLKSISKKKINEIVRYINGNNLYSLK